MPRKTKKQAVKPMPQREGFDDINTHVDGCQCHRCKGLELCYVCKRIKLDIDWCYNCRRLVL